MAEKQNEGKAQSLRVENYQLKTCFEDAGLRKKQTISLVAFLLDADNYETVSESLPALDQRNYSWMDIITIDKDQLPNYEDKLDKNIL
ncbi:hypothetical protein Y1Q_0011261 [Alligator mississippiensis]|uniref:Uncharacterized protein n=1 Tax=Alligator mississippiensis TaxID=8496 RepID=A0A151N7X8_ALLMI|nr:hypothetical protein Y1Q_0011261 [Alligator mississippiensis]